MPDYIDRTALLFDICAPCKKRRIDCSLTCELVKTIKKQPTIEVDEKETGCWFETSYPVLDEHTMTVEYRIPNGALVCSNCYTAFRKDNMAFLDHCQKCGSHNIEIHELKFDKKEDA